MDTLINESILYLYLNFFELAQMFHGIIDNYIGDNYMQFDRRCKRKYFQTILPALCAHSISATDAPITSEQWQNTLSEKSQHQQAQVHQKNIQSTWSYDQQSWISTFLVGQLHALNVAFPQLQHSLVSNFLPYGSEFVKIHAIINPLTRMCLQTPAYRDAGNINFFSLPIYTLRSNNLFSELLKSYMLQYNNLWTVEISTTYNAVFLSLNNKFIFFLDDINGFNGLYSLRNTSSLICATQQNRDTVNLYDPFVQLYVCMITSAPITDTDVLNHEFADAREFLQIISKCDAFKNTCVVQPGTMNAPQDYECLSNFWQSIKQEKTMPSNKKIMACIEETLIVLRANITIHLSGRFFYIKTLGHDISENTIVHLLLNHRIFNTSRAVIQSGEYSTKTICSTSPTQSIIPVAQTYVSPIFIENGIGNITVYYGYSTPWQMTHMSETWSDACVTKLRTSAQALSALDVVYMLPEPGHLISHIVEQHKLQRISVLSWFSRRIGLICCDNFRMWLNVDEEQIPQNEIAWNATNRLPNTFVCCRNLDLFRNLLLQLQYTIIKQHNYTQQNVLLNKIYLIHITAQSMANNNLTLNFYLFMQHTGGTTNTISTINTNLKFILNYLLDPKFDTAMSMNTKTELISYLKTYVPA